MNYCTNITSTHKPMIHKYWKVSGGKQVRIFELSINDDTLLFGQTCFVHFSVCFICHEYTGNKQHGNDFSSRKPPTTETCCNWERLGIFISTRTAFSACYLSRPAILENPPSSRNSGKQGTFYALELTDFGIWVI